MTRLDKRQGGWALLTAVGVLGVVGAGMGSSSPDLQGRSPDQVAQWVVEGERDSGDAFAVEESFTLEQAPRLPIPENARNPRLVQETVAVAAGGAAPDAALAAQLAASQKRISESAGTTVPIPTGATHVFPVLGGGRYSNDWGAARATTGSHQGLDIFNELGTPLVAVADGVVFKVGWNRVGGWRLWLRDDLGHEYYYAHLLAFSPVPFDGVRVKAGTVLGYMGTSGDAQGTPPHLHFEVHPGGGAAVPPIPYVSRWPWLSSTG